MTPNLTALVTRYGGGTNLRRAVMRQERWTPDDWYRQWPTFGAELERVLREVRP